jgi:hypothetical protein
VNQIKNIAKEHQQKFSRKTSQNKKKMIDKNILN